jgi:hypothetical protein
MLKKALLFLSALTIGAGSIAQTIKPCGTDEVYNKLKEKYPQIAITEAQLEAQMAEGLKHLKMPNLGKSTADPDQLGNPDFIYHIPIVVHIVHDYNLIQPGPPQYFVENLTDNVVYNAVKEWNEALNKENPDTIEVIAPFKKYIGNPHIRLHLATKDPNGNPTNGITRHYSYLTHAGDDIAKLGGWPNTSYMNIWVIEKMSSGHTGAAAYAYKPASGQQLPWYDGVIVMSQYVSEETFIGSDKTIPHELAHTFNIDHVWGGTNEAHVACGDDNVDDTPPTKGHGQNGSPIGCAPVNIYDTVCSFGYLKVYPSSISGIDSLVNYPDTNNAQNIMDYTYCSRMFSKGQAYRMHEALNTNVAGRNNLWSTANLTSTGALEPKPDLAPVADFYAGFASGGAPNYIAIGGVSNRKYFMCANTNDNFTFFNASHTDTITGATWSFSNNPIIATQNDSFVRANFATPGWVDATLTVTGNNGSGTGTTTKRLVYAADKDNKIDPMANGMYYQEFNSDGDLDKWPIFNYYNNEFKWQINNNTGFYDKTSIQYTGYDTRGFPESLIGSPEGDLDDFFTPAFDLSGMTSGDCNLNYMFSGTAMSAFANDMRDSMYVHYSIDCGKTWKGVDSMSQDELFNNGNLTTPFQPSWFSEWELMSLNIPPAARVNGVFFRFRYKPHVIPSGEITSNNFYIDRINISNFPLGANTMITEERKVVIAPNPTSGSANVIISGELNTTANVVVTDITGKLVYQTSQKITSTYTTVEIPAESLTAKGIYMVQVKTGAQSITEKLVVY